MKERPILFSGPMVRALLEGRKTVTRRAIKHQPDVPVTDAIPRRNYPHGPATVNWYWRPQHGHLNGAPSHGWDFKCPYGEPGDRLWVRETWMDLRGTGVEHRPTPDSPLQRYAYGADSPPGSASDEARKDFGLKWRPSIHMPRAASRILLEITAVRVERLQDGEGETTFESRYLAEGINRIHHGDGEYYYHAFESEPGPRNWIDPFDAWRELWTSVNGSTSWAANPWVWVVEFKVVTP
ncbi:MAG: hypothetical protein NDI93_00770 [Pseudomonas sp.]|nr:hypothetical protein [Pseudomonas sp.]